MRPSQKIFVWNSFVMGDLGGMCFAINEFGLMTLSL